jgi:type IV pilus assembly protein PilC
MKLFYKAINKEGEKIRGVLDATDTSEAAVYLRSRGFYPVDIRQESKSDLGGLLKSKGKVKSKDLVLFTRQIASMLSAGITLIRALQIYKEQIKKPVLVDLVTQIESDVEEGKTFSDAIEKHPSVFPAVYISLVKAGENSGLFDKVLNRLADNLEKQQKLKGMVRSALMYPAIVVILMVVVITIIMVFVVPQLTTVYTNLNVELPLPTRIVIGASNFLKNYLPLIIGFIALLVFAYKRWHKTERGKLTMDTLRLRLPIFGKVTSGGILTEFSRTLGLLVGSGTLVVDALNQVAKTSGNYLYERAIRDVAKRVEKGVPMGEAMSVYPLFPPLLVQLVKIGEQTGKMDETLTKASEYFENEVNDRVKNLTTAMEPLIMSVLGGVVAFLLISVITPIYKITQSF